MKAIKKAVARLIAIAHKGTALCFAQAPKGYEYGKPLVLDRPHYHPSINQAHSAGKASGVLAYDLCQFVADRGEAIRLFPVKLALKKGIVRKLVCNATLPSGKTVRVETYPSADFSFEKKQPAYVATSLPQGRFERASTCSATFKQGKKEIRRNATLCAELSASR